MMRPHMRVKTKIEEAMSDNGSDIVDNRILDLNDQ